MTCYDAREPQKAMTLPADIQSRFGAAVRTRRKRLDISQEELAGRAGLHRTYVADVERGARNLSLASIAKLANALEVPMQALFSQAADTVHQVTDGLVEILLVEHNIREAEAALDALGAASLTNHIDLVRDGIEALEFAFCTGRHAHRRPEDRPQVILLELDLPGMSGLEVLRRLKEDKRTRAIPVVMLTSSRRNQDVVASLRLGAETCVVKPVNFTRLAALAPRLKLSWALLRPASKSTS